MKKRFLFNLALEGDLLEAFQKDMKKYGGKLPQTLSKILEERYGAKDTIKRGYHHLRTSNAIAVEITNGKVTKQFEAIRDASDYIICSESVLSKRSDEFHPDFGKPVKGWTIKRI